MNGRNRIGSRWVKLNGSRCDPVKASDTEEKLVQTTGEDFTTNQVFPTSAFLPLVLARVQTRGNTRLEWAGFLSLKRFRSLAYTYACAASGVHRPCRWPREIELPPTHRVERRSPRCRPCKLSRRRASLAW